jgi:hypothetical protein
MTKEQSRIYSRTGLAVILAYGFGFAAERQRRCIRLLVAEFLIFVRIKAPSHRVDT